MGKASCSGSNAGGTGLPPRLMQIEEAVEALSPEVFWRQCMSIAENHTEFGHVVNFGADDLSAEESRRLRAALVSASGIELPEDDPLALDAMVWAIAHRAVKLR